MVFKLNISDKGKAWKKEIDSEAFIGKKIGESIEGNEISSDLSGYGFEITGATDNSGFAHKGDIQGTELRSVLLTLGWGMHKRPRKLGKKKVQTPHGLRLKKTYRGNQLSEKTVLINLKVLKHGAKQLAEIFPEQNKSKEEKPVQAEAQTQEQSAQ